MLWNDEKLRAQVAFLRANWSTAGTEGEAVHGVCDAIDRLTLERDMARRAEAVVQGEAAGYSEALRKKLAATETAGEHLYACLVVESWPGSAHRSSEPISRAAAVSAWRSLRPKEGA